MIERTDAVEEHGEAFNEAPDEAHNEAHEAPTDAALLAEARRLILKHLPAPGVRLTDVPGLALYHIASNDFIERNAGELLVSFIVSGRKATAVGDRVLEYGPGQSLVCGIASPTEFHTLDASPESPFLALAVSLDPAILMEYAAAIGLKASDANSADDPGGVFVIRPDVELARAFLRLLRLLERPSLVAVRAPLALRDLHALLLDSKEAATLRDLAIAGSVGRAVSAAAEWLRRNYADNCSVADLAERSHMSPPTFHRHFRRLTGLSPVQFRKRVRLYEARKLLLSRRMNVAGASFAVGYESSSQFVRDYKGLFGEPPLRDIRRLSATEPTGEGDAVDAAG